MITKTTSQLRPEMTNRIRRENPNLKELDGPVLETESYVPSWGLQEVGMASKMVSLVPQALERTENKYPSIKNLLSQAQTAVFSTLPLEGAVIGLTVGDADRSQDNDDITSASLHALSLAEPFISDQPLGTLYVDGQTNQAYIHLTADKVSVEVPKPVDAEARKAEDMSVLQTLRDLFESVGGRLAGAPTKANGWGRPSEDGKLLLEMDYGSPQNLKTPSGEYSFASGSLMMKGGTQEKFRKALEKKFDVRVVQSQRDDSGFGPDSFAYQNQSSGPILEITPKDETELSPFRGFPESMDTPEGFEKDAAVRLLDQFLNKPKKSDKSLSAEDAGAMLKAAEKRRTTMEALDRGESVDGLSDKNGQAGVVEYDKFHSYKVELDSEKLEEEETSYYIGKTFRIERRTADGIAGIELKGSGRYAEGVAYSVNEEGGRKRDLFFKETMK
ncbi:MAG: hypothetical protein KC800_07140 [Candidatus Eremiobacteraeota bacterium]|nr:hypothetical protein [Candidatus Eremiobacteraeota bacterium]